MRPSPPSAASTAGAPPDEAPTRAGPATTVIGRQSIRDRQDVVTAYELLFRTVGGTQAGVLDAEKATTDVIVSAVTEVGLDDLVGDRSAFINIPRSFLVAGRCSVLPPDRVVLEILEDVEPDAEVVAAVRRLVDQGYRVALDDFEFRPEFVPLLELAEIVKFDVLALQGEALERTIEQIAPYGCRLLAEKVEDRAELPALRALGFEMFQGYGLERPQIVEGRRGETNRAALVQVLADLYRPDVEPVDVVDTISHDPTLSYSLLRIVNSAAVRRAVAVKSLHQAVVLLGISTLQSWVAMLLMTRVVEGAPHSLVATLVRAKLCDLLAEDADLDPNVAFTVGMLASLPALLGEPLPTLVERLSLDPVVVDALIEREGPYGRVLAIVLAYEAEDGDALAGLEAPRDLAHHHLASMSWARELTTLMA